MKTFIKFLTHAMILTSIGAIITALSIITINYTTEKKFNQLADSCSNKVVDVLDNYYNITVE